MKHFHLILLIAAIMVGPRLLAQTAEQHPQRTPEEIALKQTEMLVRELNITDSVQRDTIYGINLKYARMRVVSNTRAENLERLQQVTEDLRHVLTKEQFDRFMNRQVNTSSRYPRQAVGRMPQNREDAVRQPSAGAPQDEREQTPPTP